MYERFFKRLIDLTVSVIALLILWPVMAIAAVVVKLSLGSPVIFKQERVGKDEKVFTMYKFRTMSDSRDSEGKLLPDDERKTKVGNVLRSIAVDELPELFNIIKGDLSIVGPRPLLKEYLPYYTPEERTRHKVRGGLTQPEVLHGAVIPTWDEQLRYEAEYVKKVSFITDLKIVFLTVPVLLKRAKMDYGNVVRMSLDKEREGRIQNSK